MKLEEYPTALLTVGIFHAGLTLSIAAHATLTSSWQSYSSEGQKSGRVYVGPRSIEGGGVCCTECK
jgi:hypothetical protein